MESGSVNKREVGWQGLAVRGVSNLLFFACSVQRKCRVLQWCVTTSARQLQRLGVIWDVQVQDNLAHARATASDRWSRKRSQRDIDHTVL